MMMTLPSITSSAESAHHRGWLSSWTYKHVHPLRGGLDAWRRAGFPVEPVRVEPHAR